MAHFQIEPFFPSSPQFLYLVQDNALGCGIREIIKEPPTPSCLVVGLSFFQELAPPVGVTHCEARDKRLSHDIIIVFMWPFSASFRSWPRFHVPGKVPMRNSSEPKFPNGQLKGPPLPTAFYNICQTYVKNMQNFFGVCQGVAIYGSIKNKLAPTQDGTLCVSLLKMDII